MYDKTPDAVHRFIPPASTTIRPLYNRYIEIVSGAQELANNELQVGGMDKDCEIDEVAFRQNCCEPGTDSIVWTRYIVAARRGSSHVYIGRLEDRPTKGTGTGGGGSLARHELVEHTRQLSIQPLFRPGSVIHTDGAKAYKHPGRM